MEHVDTLTSLQKVAYLVYMYASYDVIQHAIAEVLFRNHNLNFYWQYHFIILGSRTKKSGDLYKNNHTNVNIELEDDQIDE